MMHAPLDIAISVGEVGTPSTRSIEIVERKGIGHPDTMADLVAETMCYRYGQHCLSAFGFVPNHSADKVTLAGSAAAVRLGGYDVVEPVRAYYFGKVTRSVGEVPIPVEEIFEAVVDDVLTFATRYPKITQYTVKQVRAVVGRPVDHHPGYYHPESLAQLRSIATTERVANDTVACAGSAGRTPVEDLVLRLERYLQSAAFRALISGTGSDVKVMAIRHRARLDLTACLPFHPEEVHSWADYDERVAYARELVESFVGAQDLPSVGEVTLHLNRRDVPMRGYLAPFGTCLGKGDVGAVGRGNRYGGLISSARAMSIEAPAGKNALHHTGKIYTVLAQRIADGIRQTLGVDNEVVVTSRVGARLDRPSSITVNLAELHDGEADVRSMVKEYVTNVDRITEMLLHTDPLVEAATAYGDGR